MRSIWNQHEHESHLCDFSKNLGKIGHYGLLLQVFVCFDHCDLTDSAIKEKDASTFELKSDEIHKNKKTGT